MSRNVFKGNGELASKDEVVPEVEGNKTRAPLWNVPLCFKYVILAASGEIGRHKRLKISRFRAYRFDSGLADQSNLMI